MNDPLISRIHNRMIARVTSYEMVCATARNAPISAYFELDAHPDHRMEYTAKLDVAKINNTPRLMLTRGYGIGSGVHIIRAMDRARVGAII